MRARLFLGSAIGLGAAAICLTGNACIPHPDEDFADYQTRVHALPQPAPKEAGVFEAAAPPTVAVDGTYYGACFSELALGNEKKIFNFFTITSFTPSTSGSGGMLTLSIQPLAVEAPPGGTVKGPPAKVTKAGQIGAPIPAPATEVDGDGKFTNKLGTANVPGAGNPISGSDVQIDNAGLSGRFAKDRFCARLQGDVIKPVAAQRTLKPEMNICLFVPIKDGDDTPKFTADDYVCPP